LSLTKKILTAKGKYRKTEKRMTLNKKTVYIYIYKKKKCLQSLNTNKKNISEAKYRLTKQKKKKKRCASKG